MEILATLFKYDAKLLKRYLEHDRLAKILVMAAYLSLCAGIFFGIERISYTFFQSLNGFEEFGILTANYLIHASIILVMLFGIGASLMTGIGFASMDRGATGQLLVLPIKPIIISIWRLSKTILSNFMTLIIIGMPVFIAYGEVFGKYGLTNIIVRGFAVLLSVTVVTSAIGEIIAFLVPRKFYKFGGLATILFFAGFFLALIGLIRFIFPPEMGRLTLAAPLEFQKIFSNLPLNNSNLPTRFFAASITGENIYLLLLLSLVTAGVFIITVGIVSQRVISQFQQVSGEQTGNDRISELVKIRTFKNPLISLFIIPVLRLESERRYVVFLGTIAIFFFLMLEIGIGHSGRTLSYQNEILLFTSAWLLFFQTAFSLRLFYPFGSRIAQSSWHLLSLPILRSRIVNSSLLSILFLSIPSVIVSMILWTTFPPAGNLTAVIIAMTVPSILAISLVSVLVGFVNPDREGVRNPESSSTSGYGLLAFGLSVILGGIVLFNISRITTNSYIVLTAVLFNASVLFANLVGLYEFSIKSFRKFEN